MIELKREKLEDLDFLQIDTLQSGTCGAWHDRVKNGQNIFYGVQSGSAEFVDPTFPHDTAIRDDANPSFVNGSNLISAANSATWVHSIDSRFDEQDYSLFGSSGISPHDIGQGEIGNCWLMHGMAAVAEKPGRVERIFLNDELSSNGIYGVQLYVLGVPTTVVIDDSVPLKSSGSTIFGKVGPDGALWGILLEKAFAKTFGTYEAMISGDPRTSIAMLTGAPSERFYTSQISANALFDIIKAANEPGVWGMVSAGTPSSSGGDSDRSATGMAQSHAYTVLSAHEVTDGNGITRKLLRVRNPWGQEQYQGPFSDDDTANWDATL